MAAISLLRGVFDLAAADLLAVAGHDPAVFRWEADS
jgi:hypothetical protein